jgi:hypothetical protein
MTGASTYIYMNEKNFEKVSKMVQQFFCVSILGDFAPVDDKIWTFSGQMTKKCPITFKMS